MQSLNSGSKNGWLEGSVSGQGDSLDSSGEAAVVRYCVMLGAPVIPLRDAPGQPAKAALDLGNASLCVQLMSKRPSFRLVHAVNRKAEGKELIYVERLDTCFGVGRTTGWIWSGFSMRFCSRSSGDSIGPNGLM